jgi:hypothetical protein
MEKEKQNIFSKGNKKTISTVVGIIFALLAYFGVQQLFKASSIDKQLINIANDMNKLLPMMGDSETRLDNTMAFPDKVFQYTYTLINYDAESIDTVEMKRFMETNIKNNLKTNPQMQWQRDNKVTLRYYYKDKNGMYVCTITVKPEQY